MTKVLDIPQSIKAANGNVSLAKELFTMLLDDLKLRIPQIESSFHTSNMNVLSEHIHKLYGATAYCIVPPLRERTAILDKLLKQKKFLHLSEPVNNVLVEMKKIISAGPELINKTWQETI